MAARLTHNRENSPQWYQKVYQGSRELQPYSQKDVEHLRETANTIAKYGWVREAYGDCEKGFCVSGAVDHVLDTELDKICDSLGVDGPYFLKLSDQRWADEMQIRRALFDFGPIEIGNAPIHFNDVIAKDADEVIAALRLTADKLEAHLEGMGNE
jgi:hypothetical protein